MLAQSHPGVGASEPSDQQGGQVGVRKLILNNFRNYASVELSVDAAIVVLTGANGAGKTNILEALSFLSPGRGLRNSHLGEVTHRVKQCENLVQNSSDGWSVRVHLTNTNGPVEIGTGLASADRAKRTILINDLPARSQNDLANEVGIVWMTPDMDRLFHDSSGQRRRFLDRLVYGFDTQHAARITAYTKTIRERARLLKARRAGAPTDTAWLSALEDTAAQQGIAVAAARRDIIQRLNGALGEGELVDRQNEHRQALPGVRITLVGKVDGWLESCPAAEAEDKFRTALELERNSDAAAGRTETGPHRSDLETTHLTQNCAAVRCSTGEQKAILLAMVLAYAEILSHALPASPIMLLDEATAHLDSRRRIALFARLIAYPGQVWMTGTDLAPFAPLSNSVSTLTQISVLRGPVLHFEVEDGQIIPISNP